MGVFDMRPRRQRPAFEPRQPAAGALEHPGAAGRIGGDAPGCEAIQPNGFVRPPTTQIVHQHAIGQRDIQHAIMAGGEVGGAFRQAQPHNFTGQMRAGNDHGSDIAVRIGLFDPPCQAAMRIERTRHALERTGGGCLGGADVGRGWDCALARESEHPAAAIPDHVAAGWEMAPIGQQPETESVGVHQHSSGTTGTATASGSA
jgi:hypothetical protein